MFFAWPRPSGSSGSRSCAPPTTAHPERFQRGVPVDPPLPTAAWINKPPASPALAGPEGAAHDDESQISDADCLSRLDIFRPASASGSAP